MLVQEKHIDSMIQDFKAESIANTLWAYATAMRHPGERILDVLRQSEKIVGSFDVRDVADALWALAVFSINCPNSFKPGHWRGVEQIGRRAEDLAGFHPYFPIRSCWTSRSSGARPPGLLVSHHPTFDFRT